MSIIGFKPSDLINHLNSLIIAPKYIFFNFLLRNNFAGFIQLAFLEKY
jgi:hypothetical protein